MSGNEPEHDGDGPTGRNQEKMLKLVGEIYRSIMLPERFIEVLELWDRNVTSATSGVDDVLPVLEDQLSTAVPLLENSLRDIRNKDELINRVMREARPSLLLSPDFVVVGSNEGGRKLFGLRDGDRLDVSLLDAGGKADLERAVKALEDRESGFFSVAQLATNASNVTSSSHLVGLRLVRSTTGHEGFLLLCGMELVLSQQGRDYFQSTFNVTDAEMAVATMVASGLRPVDIAKARGIREDTIKKQVASLREKTSTKTTTALVSLLASFSQVSTGASATRHNSQDARSITNKAGQTYTMPSHHKLVKVNGKLVEYFEYGPVAARPLVVLHSSMVGFVLPRDLVEVFIARGFRVIVPYRPGYGLSAPLDKPFSLDAVAGSLIDFLNVIGVNRFAMLAGTIGLPIAMSIAASVPDRVNSITGIAGYVPIDPKELTGNIPAYQRAVLKTAQSNRTLAKFLVLSGYKLFLQQGAHTFLRRVFKASADDLTVIENASALGLLSIGLRVAGAQGVEAMLDDTSLILQDHGHLIRKTVVPVKLMHGESDPIYRMELIEEFCRKNERFELSRYERCGQLLIYSSPVKVAEEAADFIDSFCPTKQNEGKQAGFARSA